jgi:hypothetical protein
MERYLYTFSDKLYGTDVENSLFFFIKRPFLPLKTCKNPKAQRTVILRKRASTIDIVLKLIYRNFQINRVTFAATKSASRREIKSILHPR